MEPAQEIELAVIQSEIHHLQGEILAQPSNGQSEKVISARLYMKHTRALLKALELRSL